MVWCIAHPSLELWPLEPKRAKSLLSLKIRGGGKYVTFCVKKIGTPYQAHFDDNDLILCRRFFSFSCRHHFWDFFLKMGSLSSKMRLIWRAQFVYAKSSILPPPLRKKIELLFKIPLIIRIWRTRDIFWCLVPWPSYYGLEENQHRIA